MPTASKIVAAICFAFFGAIAAQIVIPALPEGTQVANFLIISALIGLFNGWRIMGRLTGHGYREAMGSGVRTAITIVVWALVIFSVYKMIKQSMHVNTYDGPMEAIIGAFDQMLEYGKVLLTPTIIGTFVVGGLICGAITEWAGKRWK